ncbi:hypothetical protein CQ14_41420 [Bradyrhizobium lablabi]|uniref:Uncharacterized protein n=2 Tax=Bradyrhizobium lablabi TaxID=722472 RepID=A0A0R3N025_9BRAD|nr:hypothetical protein CQ14_41420 [Bradyrhizobium lablabi]
MPFDHPQCGARGFLLLRGNASKNTSRFNSRNPFHGVLRTSPWMWLLSIDGQNVIPAADKHAEREE